jgi:hypothetical protein
MTFSNVSQSDEGLMAELAHGMETAGPAMAFTLMMQRQALADRISFQRWIESSKLLAADMEESNARAAANIHLSRRASMRLGSF